MFSQACVKNSVHKGVYPSMHWAGMCVSQHGLGGGVADTPSADTPGQTSPFPDSHCSGRYASYWNALLLPPANEVCEGYIFYTCVSFCPRGGACIVGRGVHGGGGLCMAGGMCGKGVMHGGMACVAHPPDTTRYGDTVNERAVRILLECILVWQIFSTVGKENPDNTRNLVIESPVVLHFPNI